MRLRYDSDGDGPYIENLCATCETYCGGECDERWDCSGCNLSFPLDGDEPRNVVDAETYCGACALELELWLMEEVA